MRLVTPWHGVWFADVDVVLDEIGIVPKGPCVLTIGTTPMKGTIDSRASGSFAKTAKVRVLGGGGGWDKKVLPLPFSNPAGVLSSAVYAATGAEVLETVVDVLPTLLASKAYLRSAGPASSVFGARDWYVSPLGVTFVGPRLPLPYNPATTEILSWDPLTRVAELSGDDPIAPGTILLDPLRFDGPLIVRDVEQTWGAAGARATCWCAEEKGSRLAKGLAAFVTATAGVPYLKTYVYRVVLQDPALKTLALQIVDRTTGAPDALPIEMWMGVPGASAKPLPGSEVLVTFANGDPGRPYVVGFKPAAKPLELSFDAIRIAMGLGAKPVATAPEIIAWAAAVVTACASAPGGPIVIAPLSASVTSSNLWAD